MIMTTQKAEGPRGGGGGGGRALLALAEKFGDIADSWDTFTEADKKAAARAYRHAERELRTIATTLAAREDGWQPNRVHDTEVSVYAMANDIFLIRVREDWYRGRRFHHLSPEEFVAACKAPAPKAPTAGEGDPLMQRMSGDTYRVTKP
jgi:hypothetical protein